MYAESPETDAEKVPLGAFCVTKPVDWFKFEDEVPYTNCTSVEDAFCPLKAPFNVTEFVEILVAAFVKTVGTLIDFVVKESVFPNPAPEAFPSAYARTKYCCPELSPEIVAFICPFAVEYCTTGVELPSEGVRPQSNFVVTEVEFGALNTPDTFTDVVPISLAEIALVITLVGFAIEAAAAGSAVASVTAKIPNTYRTFVILFLFMTLLYHIVIICQL